MLYQNQFSFLKSYFSLHELKESFNSQNSTCCLAAHLKSHETVKIQHSYLVISWSETVQWSDWKWDMSANQSELSWREMWHENYTMLNRWSKKVDQNHCKKDWKNHWKNH